MLTRYEQNGKLTNTTAPPASLPKIFGRIVGFFTFFQKSIDRRRQMMYNIARYPKTAGSRKSESHPAEEKKTKDLF
jgi:hypothetical protein